MTTPAHEERRALPGYGSPDTREDMEALARRNRRSLAAEIAIACEAHIARYRVLLREDFDNE